MIKILSIDGGGIRGILPGVILNYMEEQLQIKSENPNARLADFFDLFAGTSTGGVLVSLYLSPDDKGRPKFTAGQALDLYLNHGTKIFKRTIGQTLRSMNGIADEKYSSKQFEKTSRKFLGDLRLSQMLRPCLITSYEIENRKAHFFTSHDATEKKRDFFMTDVARATSAAPTYFECAHIESISGKKHALVDGGVFANNPALCAYSEARNMTFTEKSVDKPRASQMFILSLGTGSEPQQYEFTKAKKWGKIKWIQPVIDIMMSGSSETVHFHLNMLFNAADVPKQYIRIEPKIFDADKDMDNAKPTNIKALHKAGLKNIDEQKSIIDSAVDAILAE